MRAASIVVSTRSTAVKSWFLIASLFVWAEGPVVSSSGAQAQSVPPAKHQAPSAPESPKLSHLSAADWQADLRYFATEIPKRHKNAFHHVSRAEFDRDVAALESAIPSL